MGRQFAIFLTPKYSEPALAVSSESVWVWEDGSVHAWEDGQDAYWDFSGQQSSSGEMLWEDGNVIIWEDGVIMEWEPYNAPIDATPDPFLFTNLSGVATSTQFTSSFVTVEGIDATVSLSGTDIPLGVSITVTGGEYSVNGGAFTSSEGSVYLGDVIRLRVTSSASTSTDSTVTLTIGGVSSAWVVNTAAAPPDTTPAAFAFTDVTAATRSTLYISNYVTISGINAPAAFELVRGEYSVNDGAWVAGVVTAGSGPNVTVNNGDTIRVRLTSSASYSAAVTCILTVGGVSDTYSVTTDTAPAPDTTPTAFTFTDLTDVQISTEQISNAITVLGINAPATLEVDAGEYSINNGAWGTANTTVNLNDQVRVRHTSSGSYSTTVDTELTIGGVSDIFSTTTAASPGSNSYSALATPSWLVEAEDYVYTKCGYDYINANFQTRFAYDAGVGGTVATVNTSAELTAAITAAKSDSTKKGIHLNPGAVYTWQQNALDGLHRAANDCFFIRTTPGAASQAQLSQVVEQTGDYSGIAFVDLYFPQGLRLIGPFTASADVAEDILIERCRGYVDIQGQRISGLPGNPCLNIQLRLNDFSDHWGAPGNNLTHGIFAYNIDGLLMEGNIVDHNGWNPAGDRNTAEASGGPNARKHNIYISRPSGTDSGYMQMPVLRFNFISRASSHGAHMKGGVIAYRNIFSCNPIGLQLGYGDNDGIGSLYSLYGIVDDSVCRDNMFIGSDDIRSTLPMGVAVWATCLDNALVDDNYMLYDHTSTTNSSTVRIERDWPVDITITDNVSLSWNGNIVQVDTGNTPTITQSGNSWNSGSISAPAQAIAYQLGGDPTRATRDAWIDAYKLARRRLGVDITELKTWMTDIIAGITP